MSPTARGCLAIGACAGLLAIIAAGWIALAVGSCDYRLISARGSPTGRYVAELYGADCGLGSYFNVVLMRDLSAFSFPNLDGSPPGDVISTDFEARGGAILWEGETVLVLQHAGARAPALERVEWGGVRIETRRAP